MLLGWLMWLFCQEIQLWHQRMYAQRPYLEQVVREFSMKYPRYRFRVVYKETEELRSAYKTAALGGSGPDLIYAPSDVIGLLATAGLLKPLQGWLPENVTQQIRESALVVYNGQLYGLGDSLGNFLMVIYNKKILSEPANHIRDWVKQLQQLTVDFDQDGNPDQWGLVFNSTEPFFAIPWILGFGGRFVQPDPFQIFLNEPPVAKALQLLSDFRWRYRIMPKDCDYETANTLFKNQRAAVIINGDWAWGDYDQIGLEWGIAPFPIVDERVGQPPVLVSSRAYAVNPKVDRLPEDHQKVIQELLAYLVSYDVQLNWAKQFRLIGSHKDFVKWINETHDPFWKQVESILKVNQPMPTHAGMRAVWDAFRPVYQGVLSGQIEPAKAPEMAQSQAQKQVELMFAVKSETPMRKLVLALGYLSVALLFIWIVRYRNQILADVKQFQTGYLMMLPALLLVTGLILYPLVYNLIISFSNLSLLTFKDWKIVGLSNFEDVLLDGRFYWLMVTTIVWALVNVFFHVLIGFWLAIFIDWVLPWKWFWRSVFIIPWAVPQFISALSWRAFLHDDFGLLNQILRTIAPGFAVNWLGHPFWAFVACIVVNVWLGFPFMMLVTLGALKNIPPHLYEAAQIDGANRWQIIRFVVWPLVWQLLKPAVVLGFFWTFNNFNVVWLVTNGGEPADSVHILVTYAFKVGFGLYRYGYAAAFGLIVLAFLGLISYKLVRKPS